MTGGGREDILTVSLAVARGVLTRESAREAIRSRSPGSAVTDSLGLSDEVARDARTLSRLPPEERDEALEIFRDLFPLTTELAQRPTLVEAAPSEGPRPARLGRYVIEGELGRGGMGVVYKARDPLTGQAVAVKCMLRADDPTEAARFAREARTAAGLSHPNIVRVCEVGEHEGLPYLAMEFVPGKPLSEVLSPHRPKEERLPLEKAVELVRQSALALGHAHERRIVHRDVKPQNIMVDESGGARVMDFGLAREMRRGLTVTSTGDVIGTPQYMSPEQARGDRAAVGPGTDVWALGVILYEAAARTPPFDGETAAEVLHRITHEDPLPVRRRNPAVAVDLQTVIMKCLEADPKDRYATATRLAEDLGRWLEGIPVAARPPSLVRRIRRKLARRKGSALGLSGGLAAAAIVAAVLLPKVGSARKEAETAAAGRAAAEQSMALWARISNFIAEAEINARAGETKTARQKLEEGIGVCRSFLLSRELPHARYFLGRMLRGQGKTGEALRELDRALELAPGMGEAHLERGFLLLDEYTEKATPHVQRLRADLARSGEGPMEPAAFLAALPEQVRTLRERALRDLSVETGQSSYFKRADGLLGRAEVARLTNQTARARGLYREVLELEPRHVGALLSQAFDAYAEGALDRAIELATKALEAHRGHGSGWYQRSYYHFWKAERDPAAAKAAEWRRLAEEDADHALAAGHERAGSYVARGLARFRRGAREAAMEDFERAIQIEPGDYSAYANRGFARWESGDADGAIADYTKAIELNPADGTAFGNRGLARARKGDREGALADYAAALRLDPRSVETLTNRATLRHGLGEAEAALADYEAALAADPKNAAALAGRSGLRRERGDVDGALADAEAAIRSNPNRADGLVARALVRLQRGDPAGARADAERALELRPLHSTAHAVRGRARAAAGDLVGALGDLDRSIELDPAYASGFDARGQVRWRKGDAAGALRDFDESVRLLPGSAQSHLNRGHVRMMTGDLDGALTDYNRAVDLKPGHALTYLNRAMVRRRKDDLDGALADLGRALELNPRDPSALHERGIVRWTKGDLAGARADLDECLVVQPASAEALRTRAAVRKDAGDRAGAIADLTKALEIAPRAWRQRAQAQAELDALKRDK